MKKLSDAEIIITRKKQKEIFTEVLIEGNKHLFNNEISEDIKNFYMKKIKQTVSYQISKSNNHYFGTHFRNKHLIWINIKKISECQLTRNMHNTIPLTFEQLICETLTHEEIHEYLEFNINSNASKQYDNIFRRLRRFGVMA